MVEQRLFSLRFLRAVLLAGAFAAVVACVAVAFLAMVEALTQLGGDAVAALAVGKAVACSPRLSPVSAVAW